MFRSKKIDLLNRVAFNNKAWKLDADGHIELRDGNPIMLGSDGKEMVVDHNTISRLNNEAKENRVAKEKAEATLATFEGINPEKARAALETISKIDQKSLIDAGEVDKVRDTIKAQYETQVAEKERLIADTQSRFDNLVLSNAFTASEFINTRLAVPREMFEATFRSNFKVEEGKIVPLLSNGEKLMSPTRFGEVADFDEAVEIMVNNYKHKDHILKPVEAAGTGGTGGGANTGKQGRFTRSQFQSLDPVKQSEVAKQVASGEAVLVD